MFKTFDRVGMRKYKLQSIGIHLTPNRMYFKVGFALKYIKPMNMEYAILAYDKEIKQIAFYFQNTFVEHQTLKIIKQKSACSISMVSFYNYFDIKIVENLNCEPYYNESNNRFIIQLPEDK